jgi:hypothetical protein
LGEQHKRNLLSGKDRAVSGELHKRLEKSGNGEGTFFFLAPACESVISGEPMRLLALFQRYLNGKRLSLLKPTSILLKGRFVIRFKFR